MKSFNQYLKEVKEEKGVPQEGEPHQNAGKGGVIGGFLAGVGGNLLKHINTASGGYDGAETGTVSKKYRNQQMQKKYDLDDKNANRAQEYADIKNDRAQKFEDIKNQTDDLKAQLSTGAISLADYQKAITDLRNKTTSLRDAHRTEDAERRKEDAEIAAEARRTKRRTSGGSPAAAGGAIT